MNKLLLIYLVLVTTFAAAQTETLNLSSDIWPPFTDVEGEKSIALDIVENALARSGIKAEYTILEFEEVF